MKLGLPLILLSVLALGAFSVMAMSHQEAPRAPEPAKSIDTARFYTGRWYEIARTPMKITDGCVAGATDFRTGADGRLMDRDSCRKGAPDGKEKVFGGPITILDPGQNTKIKVSYKVFGLFTAPKTYWILDRDDDYRWYILSDPKFENLSLFTRDPRPPQILVEQLAARARALGYDTSKLEYPALFPVGEGRPPSH